MAMRSGADDLVVACCLTLLFLVVITCGGGVGVGGGGEVRILAQIPAPRFRVNTRAHSQSEA
jgi:hypothetical protein